MAEFSKQWCDLNDTEIPWDFDILTEVDNLPPGHYFALICEGFGFVAVGKDENDEIILAMPDDKDDIYGGTVTWKKYDEIVK